MESNLRRNQSYSYLILEFWPPELWENKCLSHPVSGLSYGSQSKQIQLCFRNGLFQFEDSPFLPKTWLQFWGACVRAGGSWHFPTVPLETLHSCSQGWLHNLQTQCIMKILALSFKSINKAWLKVQFSSVQLPNRVQLFATPWTAARQASQPITSSQSMLKFMSIELVMPSSHLSSPSPPVFSLSQHEGLFQNVSSLHQVEKVLELQFQHQSFQRIFRTDFL